MVLTQIFILQEMQHVTILLICFILHKITRALVLYKTKHKLVRIKIILNEKIHFSVFIHL